jgi:hypothetical protein
VAFLLSAVALLVLARGRPAALAVAGLAAGLALGTKFSLLAPVAVVTLGMLAIAAKGTRVRSAGIWALALVATGGFWYLRNLVRAGSPLPVVSFDFGPLSYQAAPRPLTEHLELPFAHYLLDTDVWRSHFLPGLKFGFGSVWLAVVALAAAGALGAVAARGRSDRRRRVLGAVALACAIAYAVTPNSAAGREGDPWSFGLNLRYAVPAVALGLALLAAWLPRRDAWRRGAAAVLAATFALTLLAPTGLYEDKRLEALGYALAIAGAVLLATRLRTRPRTLGLTAAAAALALGAGFFAVQRHYLDHRYEPGSAGGPPTYEFARGLSDTRIGVLGATINYPLYGRDLSNRVIYVGRRGEHGAFTRLPTCRAWRAAVNAQRLRYLVVAPVSSPDLPAEEPTEPPIEAAWTAGDPAARPVYRFRDLVTVFRLDGPLDVAGCATSAG